MKKHNKNPYERIGRFGQLRDRPPPAALPLARLLRPIEDAVDDFLDAKCGKLERDDGQQDDHDK